MFELKSSELIKMQFRGFDIKKYLGPFTLIQEILRSL